MKETLSPTGYRSGSASDPHKNGMSWLTGIVVNDPLANRPDKDATYRGYDYHDQAYYNMLPSLFDACQAVSHSVHPVIFSRGTNECRGMFATDLIRYLPTVTGEFY